MEVRDAIEKAERILNQERRSPSIAYKLQSMGKDPSWEFAAEVMGLFELHTLRTKRPREIRENPKDFRLQSTNYTLLSALLSQLSTEQRPDFINRLVIRFVMPPGCVQSKEAYYPSWYGLTSDFPLLAEFVIRNGGKENFFQFIAEATPLPGHVMLLRHLEDIIALNFTILSDIEYDRLSFAAKNFRETVTDKLKALHAADARAQLFWLESGAVNAGFLYQEIVAAANGIIEECEKARYLHLKGALLDGFNLEANQDKDAVEDFLKRMGFSKVLTDSLNEADRLYQSATTQFDFKSSMGHLRSFLEGLHNDVIPAVVSKGVSAPLPGWATGLSFLQTNGVLSEKQAKFAAALYALISDEGVHPIIAEREYARLTRNVVIEYALLLLKKTEKLGLKPT